MSDNELGVTERELRYTRRRYLQKASLRDAIAMVANGIFRTRLPEVWGEGTTACASDSKKYGAYDQNLMTEWHIRYRGPGVMIYWHVEKKIRVHLFAAEALFVLGSSGDDRGRVTPLH